MWNVGAYAHGMMGRTPNIDLIASEGMLFTDHYGQPSCTVGRAAFIMGQMPIRYRHDDHRYPWLTTRHPEVRPYAGRGAQVSRLCDPIIIGKNHLGDRNEFLPTVGAVFAASSTKRT